MEGWGAEVVGTNEEEEEEEEEAAVEEEEEVSRIILPHVQGCSSKKKS